MSDFDPGTWVRQQLLERRIVMLRGDLDDALAGQVVAELMMLDGSGDDAVTLHVDSGGGPLHAAFSVIDTIDLLRVPVDAVCVGRAEGSAVGVLAAGLRRRAAPHARFQLSEPSSEVSGNARDLESWAAHHQGQLNRFVQRLATATGRPFEHIEADLAVDRRLTADEAVEYGLVDSIWRPEPGERRPPFGFGPSA